MSELPQPIAAEPLAGPSIGESPAGAVTIGGDGLATDAVRAIARDGAPVVLEAAVEARMAASAAVVARVAAAGEPVYGVTTGLGSRAGERVAPGDGSVYALRTIRGRATAVGAPLPRDITRAAMAVRLGGLATGASGASPSLARSLVALLNHRIHPRVPSTGSIGAADLCLMAHIGLGLIGEGEVEHDGTWQPAGEALSAAGLTPLAVGPRDGLAICSSSAVTVGAATLALADARDCLGCAQVSAALSMEGFRAGLDPLDPRAVAARRAPGQAWAAENLRALLDGGALAVGEVAARRLQDPLSFRCAAQLHGALRTALGWLEDALVPELTGAADNPLVDGESVIATGNFQLSAVALALDATALAIAQVAHAIAERVARLTEPRFSGLDRGLVNPGVDGAVTYSGMAPVGKTAHALVLEIRHAAAPLSIHPAIVADGVEDDSTGAAQAALRLGDQLGRLRLLVALELLVSAQAVDLAGGGRLGVGASAAHRAVRELLPPLREDRPLGPEIERLQRELIASGRLGARVDAALAHGTPG